ncbi:MAG TPA: RuvA C-terminal domain-containing protein [Polyangiaceae bacterium]
MSHAVPSGDLGELFERALDALLEKETRKRFGVGQARKARKLKERSRHVPVEIERAVWERDAAQCTFVDAEGRRCGERRFLTIEHQQPFALGGRSELDNLCLFCSAHNQASAREVFGPRHIGAKISARRQSTPEAGAARAEASGARADAPARRAESAQESGEQQPAGPHANSRQTSRDAGADVRVALCNMGFRRREAAAAVSRVCTGEPDLEIRELLKKSLWLLVPAH